MGDPVSAACESPDDLWADRGPVPLFLAIRETNRRPPIAWLVAPRLLKSEPRPEPWRHVVGGSLTAEEKADMGPYRPERAEVIR